jgi:hypothetical protein
LFWSSTIGFSKSSWCFIPISLTTFRPSGNGDFAPYSQRAGFASGS